MQPLIVLSVQQKEEFKARSLHYIFIIHPAEVGVTGNWNGCNRNKQSIMLAIEKQQHTGYFSAHEPNERWYSLSLGHSQLKNIVQDDFICQSTQRKLNFLYHFSGSPRCSQTWTAPLHVSAYISWDKRAQVHAKPNSPGAGLRLSALLPGTFDGTDGFYRLIQI